MGLIICHYFRAVSTSFIYFRDLSFFLRFLRNYYLSLESRVDTLAAVRDRCPATRWARSQKHGPLLNSAPRASCHDHVFSFQNSSDLVHRSWRRGYETGQSASKGSLLESFISVCVFPVRVFRTAFMAWHSRRPFSATVHCVSRSFLTRFNSSGVFCQTWMQAVIIHLG